MSDSGCTRRELLTGSGWLKALRHALARTHRPYGGQAGASAWGGVGRALTRTRTASRQRRSQAPLSTALLAQVLGSSCVAWQGVSCRACADACAEARAITITHGRPQIEPSACTGCGLCRDACPAPGGAIVLMPRRAAGVGAGVGGGVSGGGGDHGRSHA